MFSRLFASLFIFCFFSLSVAANNNPFAKKESIDIGADVSWKIDKKRVLATKTAKDSKGNYYHLTFNNKQLKLLVTSDAAGTSPKTFAQMEVKNVMIDGKQNQVFNWCLNNQQKHNRFLQQGLSVKKGVCVINGGAGTFVIKLNKDTLAALKKGNSLTMMLKPYRAPLDLKYDISDFDAIYMALNAHSGPVVAKAKAKPKAVKSNKKCKVAAPVKYKNIQPMVYDCNNAGAKSTAEAGMAKLINQEKAKERKLQAEREKQKKLAEEKKQKALAAKLKQEELLKVEAAALAASQAQQEKIGGEIADKMISMCEKYWSKGEHRCYCQKYIEHAPSEIQANSTCK